jgi:hypothetical protein
MSKAILELDMPNNCREHPFYGLSDICNLLTTWNHYMLVSTPAEGRRADCPIKESEDNK